MTVEVSIGDGATRLTPHPLRAAVLGEVHARPFTPLPVPSRVIHFAFDTTGPRAAADRARLAAFCVERGLPAPPPHEKHHRMPFGATVLRWEQHSEFTTYTWEVRADPLGLPFHPDAASLALPMQLVPQPGPLLVAVDLHLLADDPPRTDPEQLFDRASLAVAENSDGAALYATDFQPGPTGFVRILVIDRGMSAGRAGALVQRVIEVETYRTLALLGLPEAQRLAPSIASSERRLAEVTSQMRSGSDLAGRKGQSRLRVAHSAGHRRLRLSALLCEDGLCRQHAGRGVRFAQRSADVCGAERAYAVAFDRCRKAQRLWRWRHQAFLDLQQFLDEQDLHLHACDAQSVRAR